MTAIMMLQRVPTNRQRPISRSRRRNIVPQLRLAGLPPSLQGFRGLDAVVNEDCARADAQRQLGKWCERSPGHVPPLSLAGLRPCLQGCYGLGAPPSEEVAVADIS